MSSKTGKLLQFINYRMRVTLVDGRQVVGRFMAFDRHMNLVLGDSEEFRKLPPKKGLSEDDREQRRVLGLVILRGDEVVDLTIEGPPPADESRLAKGAAAPAGPGMGRAAGRGMPVAAPGAAPVGLAGPAPGVGAPGPGQMMPRPAVQAPPMMRPGMPPGMMPPPGMPPPGFRPGMPPPGMPPPGMPPMGGPPPGWRPGMPPPGGPPPGFRPPPPQ
ncbi:small nuclear ribonucleo -associated B [Chlorella sorokiniana]|uniref:Sm protein B n=1 Tax=Chlorella sorokiniana TaxID=3076 RepID=A0A2P6U1E8_CHLSO|nr:small nuclear ribonucleo -associated B [Chlorella sorokiniana]|eukprot:PRW60128.1 small nuclear ribonucleo -associated B [Chlorella sorokiniana]